MRNFISFIGWLLRKWFVSNNSWYRSYERAVVRDPLPLFLGTVLIYGGFWLLSLIPLSIVDAAVPTALTTWAILAVAVFGNYFRILLIEQYRQFKKERQQLFQDIKYSHVKRFD
jgi:drug/metabolite transporter (DMT)-like permease